MDWTFRAKVTRIIDGDTFEADVDLGFGHWIHGQRFRLYGVDTPERGNPDWQRATDKHARLLLFAKDESGFIHVTTSKGGKYGRWLASVPGVNSELGMEWPAPPHWR